MERKRCVVFDVDGTLANCSHRVHFLNGGRKDWPSFMAGIPNDTPHEQMVDLNHMYHSSHALYPLFVCSGRSNTERRATEEWLYKHGVKYDHLLMRKTGDYRADHIVKKELLEEIRSMGYEPWIVFDDRQEVVDMWRREGLFVLQCDPNPSHTDHVGYEFHKSIMWPLTILVGPSGSGKTEFAASHDALWNCRISSDQIRQELCGDFRDQSRNGDVFAAFHDIASTRLRAGLPVTLDATHLKNADRRKSALLVPERVPVRYVVLNRSIKDKKATGGWRNSVTVKGKPLIEHHDQVFRSNLDDILNGDGLPNVTVQDERICK